MRGILRQTLLFLRTIRWLTFRQCVYWPLRRLQRELPFRASTNRGPACVARSLDPLVRALETIGPRDNGCVARADRIIRGEFRFVGHALELSNIDWTRRYVSHLWSYNLHYFDYVVDLAWAFRQTADRKYLERFIELTSDWTLGTKGGGDGWDPYPISTRSINWIYAVLLFRDALSEEQQAFLLASVHAQLYYLEKRIEWHLMANHLQRNLQALALGSLVLSSAAADRWRRKWLPRLWRELQQQVLDDGGHFERSPTYHVIAAADFLEMAALAEAAGQRVSTSSLERLRRMTNAIDVLARPSGELHLFNDAAQDIAPSVSYVRHVSTIVCGAVQRTATDLLELPHTGYFGVAPAGTGQRLIIDCGEPGPSYQLGHTHCDLLSFEFDVGGTPVVVDSGVCGYARDPFREYVRSTRAHNTICIGGRDQHELWGVFRVARRAIIREARHQRQGDRYEFDGSYSPYFDKSILHRRQLVLQDGRLDVTDTVSGAAGRRIESYLHFAPNTAVILDGNTATIRVGTIEMEVEFSGFDKVELTKGSSEPVQGWYCPEFGRAVAAATLTGSIQQASERKFGYSLRPT